MVHTSCTFKLQTFFEDNTLSPGENLYPIPIGLPYDVHNKVIIKTKNGDKYSEPSIIHICIPNKPKNITYKVTNYTNNYYNISFSWNFKNNYEYVLINVLSGKEYKVLKTINNGNYCFQLHTPLLYNQCYDFEVYALATGKFKNMKSLTSTIVVKTKLPDEFKPEAPLLTSYINNKNIILRWNTIKNANNYKIYRQIFYNDKMENLSEKNFLCEVEQNVNTYTDNNVIHNVKYIYYIKSVTTYESKLSNYVIEEIKQFSNNQFMK